MLNRKYKFFTIFILILLVITGLSTATINNDSSLNQLKNNENDVNVDNFLNCKVEPINITLTASVENMIATKKPTNSICYNYQTDKKISSYSNNDQYPSLVTDGNGNLLCVWEEENEPYNSFKGSNNSGEKWGSERYWPAINKNSKNPSSDYYNNKTAYTLFIPKGDVMDILYFPDIADFSEQSNNLHYSIENLSNHGILSVNDADIACCPMNNPPTSDFWGIIALTGDFNINNVEINDGVLIGICERDQDQITLVFFLLSAPCENFQNISIDFDQNNQQLYLASEVDYEYNGIQKKGIMVITTRIDGKSWHQNVWRGILVNPPNGWIIRNPILCVNERRWYLTFENTPPDDDKIVETIYGDKDVSNPLIDESIELANIDPNGNVIGISAEGEMNASILYTNNNNLYVMKTNDGGETWGEQIKVNDVDGTVVNGYRNGDITGDYVVWTDSRNGNNDIYFDAIGSTPEIATLEIGNISGGLGIFPSVKNTGNTDVHNVNWSINVSGGFIWSERYFKGTIDTLKINQTKSIYLINSLSGFGAITIKITVNKEVTWVKGDEKTVNGFLIGPFVIL